MYKVLVTDDRFTAYNEEKEILKNAGAELIICPESSGMEILKYIEDADALLVNQFKLSGDIIKGLKKCRVISRYGVGYDNVDIAQATKQGIWVSRVADYCVHEVAEHALALLLAVSRRLVGIDQHVRRGSWNVHAQMSIPRVNGSTLGILGYGSMGRAFHKVCSGLGFKDILICDHSAVQKDAGTSRITDFETLLAESDYLSLHVPCTEKNTGLFDFSVLKKMKNNAVLINTSRGRIVDTQGLISRLQSGALFGAGLDVFESEPPEELQELKHLDNVVLTDHSAYFSDTSISELKTKAAVNIAAVLQGKNPVQPVNSIVST